MHGARVDVRDEMLAECAREPIHLIGATQPHGALLVLDADRIIVQASANAVERLGIRDVLGVRLGAALPGLEDAVASLSRDGEVHVIGAITGAAGARVQVLAHAIGDRVVLDVEAADPGVFPGPAELALVAEAASATTRRDEIVAVAHEYGRLVHRVSGYDRVMIYRFHPDDHGEVIAETVSPATESFLGLHYPASDIPAQARQLFLVNRVRVIVDRDAPPVPLLKRDEHEPALDLSRSALRASSPIHLEYLRNMQVRSSLTAAIRVDGQLWGLIACHHGDTKEAPHGLRSFIDLIATLLASRIAELDARRAISAGVRAAAMQTALLSAFSSEGSGDWMADVMRQGLVTSVVPCSGAALVAGTAIRPVGASPGEAALRDLSKTLLARHADDVVVIERIGDELPQLRHHAATAASCLAIRIAEDVVLMWLRPEWVTTVSWGGDPRKSVDPTDGPPRLAPRKSFAAWTEEIRGSAQPWTLEDLSAARAVQASLRGVVDRVYRVRRTLMQSNRRLADFAHMAAHDLQEPLRMIRSFGSLIERKHRDALPPQAAEHLTQMTSAAERMQWLIRDVLDYASVQDVSGERTEVDLFEAANEAQVALRQVIIETDARIDVEPLPVVTGIRRLLIQLLQNLISNAIKYRSEDAPQIRIRAVRDDESGTWRVSVADNGIGIPEQHHQRIFDAFQRVGDRAKIAGSGIGLAICKTIAEAHGGAIWVESTAGEGSRFLFTIADRLPH
ncbi:MAG TPA: ATP-binding protein [Planctomycetota bacterium]|nr:ATP-binding protein [Planctomycetota bacterium]